MGLRAENDPSFYLYVLECADGTWYTGYTVDVAERVRAHNAGAGAKYTRSRLPVRLLAQAAYATKHEAMSAEYRFKRLTRRQKERLSFVLGDRAQVGDASRYIFAYARHRGYDLPPYPLAGCGEIREFFADEGVRNVPDWYEKKLGLDERAYEALPSQTIVVVRDRADRRKAFFLDAYENLADSGFARTLSEDDLEALLSRMLAFLTGDDAFSEAETTSVGPLRGSSCAF